MELKEIKKIIQEEKSKIIIADETGPTMVIMSYEDYKRLKGGIKKEGDVPSNNATPKELESESLRIDDLPF